MTVAVRSIRKSKLVVLLFLSAVEFTTSGCNPSNPSSSSGGSIFDTAASAVATAIAPAPSAGSATAAAEIQAINQNLNQDPNLAIRSSDTRAAVDSGLDLTQQEARALGSISQ